MHVHVQSPSSAQCALGTQDLGIDPSGFQAAVVLNRQSGDMPLPAGEVTDTTLSRKLEEGNDLLLVLGEIVQDGKIRCTETILIIADQDRRELTSKIIHGKPAQERLRAVIRQAVNALR